MKSISSKLFVIFLENCIRSKFCCSSVMWPKSCKGESNVVRVQQLFSYFLETGLQLWREVTNEQAASSTSAIWWSMCKLICLFFLLPKCQKICPHFRKSQNTSQKSSASKAACSAVVFHHSVWERMLKDWHKFWVKFRVTGDDEILVVVIVNNILFFNNLLAAAVYLTPGFAPHLHSSNHLLQKITKS